MSMACEEECSHVLVYSTGLVHVGQPCPAKQLYGACRKLPCKEQTNSGAVYCWEV